MLSQRVKARTGPKKIFSSKRIGVIGFASSGKTTYAINLGSQLKDSTKKNVVCVEVVKGDYKLPSFPGNKEVKPFDLHDFDESRVNEYMVRDVVDYLLVRADRGGDLARLANFLSEQYHFIICEINVKLLDEAFTNFIYRCDNLHLLFNKNKIELTRGGHIIKDFEDLHFFDPEKIKVIMNEFGSGENIDNETGRRLVGSRIYATMPHYNDQSYPAAMRRIARETGEIVLGIALGSGGSYGFAHIGVLDVLEEQGIPIDVICGTSMGAFVAALWAAGFDFNQMRKAALEFGHRLNLFSFPGFYFPFKGIIKAKRLERVYRDIFGDITFYDLKHPLKLAAFDFFQRKATVLEEGLLYKAVAASCAIPGVFEPVQFGSGSTRAAF